MADDLQFDRAEFTAPNPTACSTCKAALTTEYFAINGQVFCAKCAEEVRRHFGAEAQAGLFGRAALLGLGAAVLGSAVYGAVMINGTFTFRILLSIGIGWLVGKAVRKGSGNLGGNNYQILAVALTYAAISGAYGAKLVHDTGVPDNASEALNLLMASFTTPISQGISSIYGLLAIAFGVWEAWQLNRPVKLEITGPHAIGSPASGG